MDEPVTETEDLLPAEHYRAIKFAIESAGMPSASAALYSRWWQLETWLRELIYVELRAKYGTDWTSHLVSAVPRQAKDAAFTHMVGPDNENPLAYLDYSQLLLIIEANWDLFSYALPESRSWSGRQDDLRQIRHRIGHLRKPHADDLARVEQTLRDLERGTFIALASYNRKERPDPSDHSDPITVGWIGRQHETARRLTQHARSQYETTLMVRASRRPWAAWPDDLADAPGILWHADFYMSARTVSAAALWRDSDMRHVKPLAIHLIADSPWHVGLTFSAADDATEISNAIGEAFDALLVTSRHDGSIPDAAHRKAEERSTREVDYRVLASGGWSIVDESTIPITSFGAGGGVDSLPKW